MTGLKFHCEGLQTRSIGKKTPYIYTMPYMKHNATTFSSNTNLSVNGDYIN